MKAPAFWWEDGSAASALLAPAAWIWGRVAAARMAGNGARAAAATGAGAAVTEAGEDAEDGAGDEAGAVALSAASSISTSEPSFTTSPTATLSSLTTPACDEGISIDALSLSTVISD